jgi:hypothetical protein
MSHFAYVPNIVDNIGTVERVLVIEQDVIDTGLFGTPSAFYQTSYNTRGGVHYDPATGEPSADQSKALRKNFAGIGYSLDLNRDAYIPPKDYPSWVLNEDSCLWQAPVPQPEGNYIWDEETLSWVAA